MPPRWSLPDRAGTGSDFALDPEPTSIDALAGLAADLGAVLRDSGPDRQHFGFAEQIVDSVYLGSSTGLRLRHVQPTGRLEMNAKNADWTASSYLGFSLRDPSEADVAAADAELAKRLGWARTSIDLPAGRYETILPPTALADLVVYAYWLAEAKAADEGRSAYARRSGGSADRRPAGPAAPRHLQRPHAHRYPVGALRRRPRLDLRLLGLRQRPPARPPGLRPTTGSWCRSTGLGRMRQPRPAAGMTPWCGRRATTSSSRPPGRARARTTWSPRPSAGCCCRRCGTSAPSTPQTMLLTGLTRDGVYLVEGGEVVGAVNNFRWNEVSARRPRPHHRGRGHRAQLPPRVG